MANKKAIYTSVTNNYDQLPQYNALDPSFDYICFTNDYPAGSKVGHWNIEPIPFQHENPIILSRFTKILPHRVLSQYKWSIWLDSNLIIQDLSIYADINNCINNNQLWSGIVHPNFDCIYQDIKECLRGGRIDYKAAVKQIHLLQSKCYPTHNGLFENNFIIRQHDNKIIQSITETWWDYFINYALRDQFSLFLVFWELKFKPNLILKPKYNTRNIKSIKWLDHRKLKLTKSLKRTFLIQINLIKMKLKLKGIDWNNF